MHTWLTLPPFPFDFIAPPSLVERRIYQAGGLDPATEHLERNLIAISLKEQLLSRPALHDLEKRGVKPKEGSKVTPLRQPRYRSMCTF